MTVSQILLSRNPTQLSHDLRESCDDDLHRRRVVVSLALLAGASSAIIALKQFGIVRSLPEPPLKRFDTDRVVGSKEAYSVLSTPDAFFGVISYATTAALAAAGGPQRASKQRWFPLLLAGKVALDCCVAAWLSWFQWSKFRALCAWCLVTSSLTFATLPFVVPEAIRAIRSRRDI